MKVSAKKAFKDLGYTRYIRSLFY